MRSQKSQGLNNIPLCELIHEYFTTILNVALNTEGFTFNCWILFISVGVFVNILL